MRTARILWLAVLAASLSSTLYSCKKDGSDPDPTKPSGTAACRLLSVRENPGNRLIWSYRYDPTSHRIIGFSEEVDDELWPATITYNGENIVVTQTDADGNLPTTTTYVRSNGRFLYSLKKTSGSPADTTRYTYDAAGRISRIDYFGYVTKLTYNADGLPAMRRNITLKADNQPIDSGDVAFEYMADTVAYNPFSHPSFKIAPGLEIIKVNRLFKTQTFSSRGQVTQTFTYSVQTKDASGNFTSINEVGAGQQGSSNRTYLYTYECE